MLPVKPPVVPTVVPATSGALSHDVRNPPVVPRSRGEGPLLAPRTPSTPRSHRRRRLSPEDLAVVELLTRYRYLTAPLIHRYVHPEVSAQAVYKRLSKLRSMGLVDCAMDGVPKGMFALYFATSRGYVVVDSPLDRDMRFSAWGIEHSLAIAELGLIAQRVNGCLVKTEREIHRDLSVARKALKNHSGASQTSLPGLRPEDDNAMTTDRHPNPWIEVNRQKHPCDLLIGVPAPAPEGRPRWIACEVEMTNKSAEALRSILAGYRRSQTLGEVVYVCGSTQIAQRVRREAASVGLALQLGDGAIGPGLRVEVHRATHSIPHARVSTAPGSAA